MKSLKIVSLLLVLTLAAMTVGGCFNITKKTTGDGNPTTASDTEKSENTGATSDDSDTTSEPGETYEEGYELTAFLDGYTNAKSPIWDKMSEAADSGTDAGAFSALLTLSVADLMILDVYFFDSVEAMGGVIMFTAIDNAYKRVNGNIIEFGYDYIYSEDKADDKYPAGSHLTCTGTYNTSSGSIHKESVDDKGEGNITRTVIEINRLSADSYASQFITSSSSGGDAETTAYFTMFKGTDIWSAVGSKAEGTDFTYNTIFEKGVGSLDDMTGGYAITTKVSYVGDKLTSEG